MTHIRRTLVVALVVAGSVLGVISPAHAAPGPYFPPNPPPQYVDPALVAMGQFPVPGLYLGFGEPGSGREGVECELKLSDSIGVPGFPADPIGEPPSRLNGELDATLGWGVKSQDPDNLFVGIATTTYQISCKNPDTLEDVGVTYTLVLYVGVPLPATGADNTLQVGVAAGIAVLGVGLVMVSRRRRPIQVSLLR